MLKYKCRMTVSESNPASPSKKVLISVPSKIFHDSSFPFNRESQDLVMEIDGEKLVVRKEK